jgi:hypothetical protein
MTENTFKKVEKTNNRLYGPRKVLVHGLAYPKRQLLRDALKHSDVFSDLPMICPEESDTSLTLEELFDRDGQAGLTAESSLATPFVIMAGLLEHELHSFMQFYKTLPLPRPVWATLTPTSATWSLKDLLKELTMEHQALQNTSTS